PSPACVATSMPVPPLTCQAAGKSCHTASVGVTIVLPFPVLVCPVGARIATIAETERVSVSSNISCGATTTSPKLFSVCKPLPLCRLSIKGIVTPICKRRFRGTNKVAAPMYSSRVRSVPALKEKAGSSSRLKNPESVFTQPPRCKCNSPLGGGIQGSSHPSIKFQILSGVNEGTCPTKTDRASTSPKL